jgi:hypothetical protein
MRPALFTSNMQPHSYFKRKLATITLMVDEEEKIAALSDEKKRVWVHKCFRSRKSEGDYWTVCKELAEDEMKFYQYFRMSTLQFNCLLHTIDKDLKKNTTFREAISPTKKLATCLR